ncbi:MAG: hypothetical protein FRX48_07338 [Lasallia pustulata]|uniref:Mitochondrial transcription factor 1 n=1 Tax=Lasallia pustulata TaxID=136370 RepID=A0A1W5D0Q1_9LECA|nr:MAG: hypothetical protein FRX48_07338 [Lasallia pustulata]SLM36562.1 rRNA adenine dimethylase-like [Lasallia pustulata]
MWKVSQRHLAHFPLLELLQKLPHTGNFPVEVVGSELCDDLLQRLGPSLARHRSCDIIDINPGAGVWSAKVHDYVKPRRHILVQPQAKRYLPFLKPLLDAPESRYSLVDCTGGKAWRLDEYVKQNFMTMREGVEEDVPETKKSNDTLLVLANLGMILRRSKGRAVDQRRGFRRIEEFFAAAREHAGFHGHGSIRMLVWMVDDVKSSLLPRTVAHRLKPAVEAEMNAHVEEIAGGKEDSEAARESSIELASANIVAQRMGERGLSIPVARRSELQQEAQDNMAREHVYSSSANLNLAAERRVPTPDWHEELLDLEAKFKAGELKEFMEDAEYDKIPYHVAHPSIRKNHPQRTPQSKRLRKLQDKRSRLESLEGVINELRREQAALDQLDLAIANGEYEGAAHTAKLEEWQRRTAQCMERVHMQSTLFDAKAEDIYDDDRRAFARPSPLLMWDHRTAEPLIANPDEFYPHQTLALLDIQPKSHVSPLLSSPKHAKTIDAILRRVFRSRAKPIAEAMATLGPGADEYLVPAVPALADIRVGGCRNLERMRCRMVTVEMVEALALAWEQWPFKVPLTEFDFLSRWGDNLADVDGLASNCERH